MILLGLGGLGGIGVGRLWAGGRHTLTVTDETRGDSSSLLQGSSPSSPCNNVNERKALKCCPLS